jgi:hypothetical protein
MPCEEDPARGLDTGAQEPVGRERPGKREGISDHDEAGEEVAAGEHQQGARAQHGELAEEKHCGDAVADEHRRGNHRDDRVDAGQGRARHGQRGKEERQQQQRNRERGPLVPPRGRQRGNKHGRWRRHDAHPFTITPCDGTL